jgi:hypothetical protein
MKIKSPYVTLLVGLVIAAVVTYLSVRAHQDATTPQTPSDPYALTTGAAR